MGDFDRPVLSTLDALRECAGVVDSAAATGLLPQSLLRRWETACEDQGLWQSDAMAIHGEMQLSRFLTEDHKVVAVDGWTRFSQGDPPQTWRGSPRQPIAPSPPQLLPPTTSNGPQPTDGLCTAPDFTLNWILRAGSYTGVGLGHDTIVRDASDMLATLNDRVAGDMDAALTARISHGKHPISGA